MTKEELTMPERNRLTNSLVQEMMQDPGYMQAVAKCYADTFSREEYEKWFDTKERGGLR